MSQNYRGLFSDWEIAVAKNLVSEYQNKWACLSREYFDDLVQECLTHWFFSKDLYDSTKGASQKTFMGNVVRNKLTDIIREMEADKRKIFRFTVSLDEPSGNNEDSPTMLEKIDNNGYIDHRFDPLVDIQLKIDIPKALKELTPRQKKLCKLLGEKGLNIKEASEYLKTPRSTVYDELGRIRKIFEKEGLGDYLK